MENSKRVQCSRCGYWSGHPGNRKGDLVCAVNIPQPSRADLEKVCGRTAYAWHNCKDFESASISVQGGYSNRCHIFPF